MRPIIALAVVYTFLSTGFVVCYSADAQDHQFPPLRPGSASGSSQFSAEVKPNNNIFETENNLPNRPQNLQGKSAKQRGNLPPVIPRLQPSTSSDIPTALLPKNRPQPGRSPNRPAKNLNQSDSHTRPYQSQMSNNSRASEGKAQSILDHSLQPAGFTAQAPQSSFGAIDLINELSPENANLEVMGQPMSLQDMLANCELRRRKTLIKQYWNTYRAWAEYRFAIDEVDWLKQLAQPRNEVDRLTLVAARSAAHSAVSGKQLKLEQQQGQLNTFLRGPRPDLLPLPSDRPLVGGYRTNFDVYASQSPMPEGLRQINRWLPKQKTLIEKRAGTIWSCRTAVLRASQAFRQGGTPAASLLQAISMCRENHTAFIDSVVDYNHAIADYAMAVKPNQLAPQRVVAMLIPVNPNWSTPNTDQPNMQMRQASLPNLPNPPQVQPSRASSGSFGGRFQNQPASQPPSLPSRFNPDSGSQFTPRGNLPPIRR